jgi:Ras family protein A
MVWDTAGQEEYEKLRPLTYKDSDIIILCYSIDSQDSYYNIIEKWYPELRYYCPTVPVVLVGNKKDIRDDSKKLNAKKSPSNFFNLAKNELFVDSIEGEHLCKRIKANHFLECSVRTGENVKEVFDYAGLIVEMNSKLIKENNKINKNGCFKSLLKCEIM